MPTAARAAGVPTSSNLFVKEGEMMSSMQVESPHYKRRIERLGRFRITMPEDLLNVFTPTDIIKEPARFAGREEALEDMINALLSEGADLFVFGERGCGKSSLVNMLHNIAKADFEVLDYYSGLRERLEKKGFLLGFLSTPIGRRRKQFNVIWVDGQGRSLDEVLREV